MDGHKIRLLCGVIIILFLARHERHLRIIHRAIAHVWRRDVLRLRRIVQVLEALGARPKIENFIDLEHILLRLVGFK